MIRYYHKSPRSKELNQLDKYRPGAWVYVENPSNDEVVSLVKKFDLDAGHVDDALDSDEMPRLEQEGEQTYLFSRFAMTTDELIIETTPILFILHPKGLITICLQPLARFERFISGKIEVDTTDPGKLVLQILDQIDDQFETYLSDISRQVKAIRARLRIEKVRNQDFIDFVVIEDELNEFMSALTPMSAILKRLLLAKHLKLFAGDKDLIEDLLLNNEQSIETSKNSVKSVVSIREAYSTIMSNDLNQIIRVLTIVTVVISIPTLIASVYGMNVVLPFDHSSMAFGGLMFVSLVISLFLLWIFRHKKWL